MDDQTFYDRLVERMRARYPGLSIIWKDKTWYHKVIGTLFFFVPTYMRSYTTTIGKAVGFPSYTWFKESILRAWRVLAHELRHIHDDHLHPVSFKFLYLFPQILGVLGFLMFLGFLWWPLWFLGLFFVAFAPWPSPWRTEFEMRAYAISIGVIWYTNGVVRQEDIDYITTKFVGWDYYRMCPDDIYVRHHLWGFVDDLIQGNDSKWGEPWLSIRELLREKFAAGRSSS